MARDGIPILLGTSVHMRKVDADLTSAARSDTKVLITGESGVGKEVVARLIHHRGKRRESPLVTINCAGIPDNLLASELFGHVRGSFTGVYTDKRGWLEQANRGTVFLDEVGEMSAGMQALLLRFLENGEIQPVGSDRRRTVVDVRVITATNRCLMDRVAINEFREDLYYRLNVIHIDVPPLRERPDDVPALLDHFIREFSARYGIDKPFVKPDVVRRLAACPWPGNVRQLRNFIEALVVRAHGGPIEIDELPRELLSAPVAERGRSSDPSRTRADVLFDRMVVGRESFWAAVREPFMARDLTRDDLREIVRRGLELTGGSYRNLTSLFNMPPGDYRRLLNFLRKFRSHLPVREFRPAVSHLKTSSLPASTAIGE